ncbi:MAG TPA: PadR family transcriptional regulator [Candidatus Binataceae bacterium]|nr:PadR family transcriptional regulator [Candidatus Binataceae bacterium]
MPKLSRSRGGLARAPLKGKTEDVPGTRKPQEPNSNEDRQLYSGLIRLHVLHHATQRPVYGLWLIEELARHGYRLSSGTLYPMLHGMEEKGYLRSVEKRSGRLARRVYRATALGEHALTRARRRVSDLFTELFEEVKESKSRQEVRRAGGSGR